LLKKTIWQLVNSFHRLIEIALLPQFETLTNYK
jgi:hypothetical protein